MIQPIRDFVLVKPYDPDQKTKSGIIIPDNAKKEVNRAEVVALGDGREYSKRLESWLRFAYEPGDIVIYNQFAGTDMGDGTRLIQDSDVWAIERKED